MLCGDLNGKEIQERGDISIHPTLVFLPGTSHGQGKLVGYIQSTGSQSRYVHT